MNEESFLYCKSRQFVVVVQLLSRVWLFAIPWTAACQASLSFTISWSLLRVTSIESVIPSNHLILYCPLLLHLILPSIGVFSSESALRIRWPKYWSFSFNIIFSPCFFLQSGLQADMSTLTDYSSPQLLWKQDFAIWFTETIPGTE